MPTFHVMRNGAKLEDLRGAGDYCLFVCLFVCYRGAAQRRRVSSGKGRTPRPAGCTLELNILATCTWLPSTGYVAGLFCSARM